MDAIEDVGPSEHQDGEPLEPVLATSDHPSVPEADYLEQSREVVMREDEASSPSDDPEIPEADALEQAMVVPLDEGEDLRASP
ncbi:MAG: hypothetical protein M3P37_11135 [Actinomycetota bacterium]|nr:hypothetical protein [Actinomycetota bacterium]